MRARASRRRSRAPRAASARPCRARRRWSRGGGPRGRRGAGRHVGGDVGDVHPDADRAAVAALGADRVVEVARGRRVDRERRQVAQVAARRARRPPTRSAAARASRSTTGSKRRRRPRSSISASSTSRAVSGRPSRRSSLPWPARGPFGATSTRSPGAACWPGARAVEGDPAPAREERLGHEEAPAPLEHRDDGPPAAGGRCRRPPDGRRRRGRSPPPKRRGRSGVGAPRAGRGLPPRRCCGLTSPRALTVLTATSSASSRRVLRVVLRLHVGLDTRAVLDATAAEVAAAGREVLADGDVERAAVGQAPDLLEDALAERARADHLGALAVLQRAGDDLRGRRRLAVDEHDDRDLRGRSGRPSPRTRAAGARGPWWRRSCPRG